MVTASKFKVMEARVSFTKTNKTYICNRSFTCNKHKEQKKKKERIIEMSLLYIYIYIERERERERERRGE